MTVDELRIAEVLQRNRQKKIIALEGNDASGKSTLCAELIKNPLFRLVEIPNVYITQPFKDYLYLETSAISSALIFAASLVDRMTVIKKSYHSGLFIQDRSLWSTVAINWVKDSDCTQEVLNIFASIYQYIPLPGHVFILDVSYETCIERIMKRPEALRKFDVVPEKEFNRNMDFYRWLCNQNVGAELIQADGKSLEKLCSFILNKVKQDR